MTDQDHGGAMRRQRLVFWSRVGAVLASVIALGILYGTLHPKPPGPPLYGNLDKVVHFLAFFTLVFVAVLTRPGRWRWMLPLAVAFGGVIELIQPRFGRQADWGDFWANNAGAVSGAVLGVVLGRVLIRHLAARRALRAG